MIDHSGPNLDEPPDAPGGALNQLAVSSQNAASLIMWSKL